MTEDSIIENSWHFKNRYLFLVLILSIVLSVILCSLVFPDYLSDNPAPLTDVMFDYVFYGILLFFIYKVADKAAVNWKALFGGISIEPFSAKYILIVLPLMALSYAGIYLLYYPLALWNPALVEELLLANELEFIWLTGENYRLANLLNFFSIVIITPIIEEVIFRGFLLTSLASKWGINKGILISSILFGIFHTDIFGASFFGVVLSVIYLNKKSLQFPIIIHITNNAVVFILYYFSTYFGESEFNVNDLYNYWWIGLAGLIIGLPWFIYFYRKEIANKIFVLPYYQYESGYTEN